MKLTKAEQKRVIEAAWNLRSRFGNMAGVGKAFTLFGGAELTAQHLRPYFFAIDNAKAGKLMGVSKTVANALILLDVATIGITLPPQMKDGFKAAKKLKQGKQRE